MDKLEYVLGTLDIEKENVSVRGDMSVKQHKFIIENNNPIMRMHIGFVYRHKTLAERFGVGDSRSKVYGGRIYITEDGILTLDGSSASYQGIPQLVGEEFAKLLVPYFQELGINVLGVNVDLNLMAHPFWRSICIC